MTTKIILATVLTILTVTSCIYDHEPDGGVNLKAGDPLPYFKISMNDGQQLTTDSLRGKKSVIIFFNTTCPDCRKELPVLEELYKKKRDVANMICISRAENSNDVGNYWNAHNLTIPYSAQTDRIIYNMFAQSGIPRIYISDEQLKIITIFTDSPLPDISELEAAICQ